MNSQLNVNHILLLNDYRKSLTDFKENVSNCNDEELAYLEEKGFKTDGSHSPSSDKAKSTDHYEAVSFALIIKGLSSLPKLEYLRSKVEAVKMWDKKGKEPILNLPMQLMRPTLELVENQTKSFDNTEKLSWLDKKVEAAKFALVKIRGNIQRPKFAMLLVKKWFTGIDQNDSEYKVDFTARDFDLTGTIKIDKVKVDI